VPNPPVSRLALEHKLGETYNEPAFHYLLSIERKRTERSGRSLLLMLVDLEDRPGVPARLHPAVASVVLSGARTCLRAVDFVGWYREGHVAGAVLIQSRDRPATDSFRLIAQRLRDALCARLPSDLARRVRVRTYQHPEPANVEAGDRHHIGAPSTAGEH
jgi:hypothetical protein